MSRPIRPTFIYIGPDKAGSSWLHEVLRAHPQVFMPDAKGLYFFDRYFDRGVDWYLSQFEQARPEHDVVGEVCQDYLAHPLAAERMEQTLGTVRVMVTLRDPADRAFSSYLHMLRSGWDAGSFAQALGRYPELVEHGRYASQLERFERHLGRDNLYLALFDDLQADPQAFFDGVTAWLGIDAVVLDEGQRVATLPAGKARSVIASRVVSWGAHVLRERDGGNFVGRVKRMPLVQRALYKPLADDKPAMTAEERSAVVTALADEVRSLDETYGLEVGRRWGWA